MNFDTVEKLSSKEVYEIYNNILEENFIIGGCTYGTCDCYTRKGYSSCYYSGCGSGSDYGWYYGWAYYTSCNNGVRGYGYWDGGYCQNAVCRQVS